MPGIVVATIDGPAADVVREALDGAGIEARLIPIRPFRQIEYLRNQHFPRFDVEVDGGREAEARAIIDGIELQAESAAVAEAEGALLSDEDAADSDVLQALPPRSPLRALALAIFIPVAGPIYAGSMWLILVSLAAHIGAFLLLVTLHPSGASGDGFSMETPLRQAREWLPFVVPLVAARVFDIIAAPLVTAIRNDARATPTSPDKDAPRAPRS